MSAPIGMVESYIKFISNNSLMIIFH